MQRDDARLTSFPYCADVTYGWSLEHIFERDANAPTLAPLNGVVVSCLSGRR